MSRIRVLAVEDDEGYQELYQQFFDLHADEFAWVLARTGDTAIATLKDDPRPFDVALLDWHLNRGTKTGFQVLQAIRSNTAYAHVVAFMITANECDQDVESAITAGADDYITKPFNTDLLAPRIRGRLDQKRKQFPVADTFLEFDGLRLDVATGVVVHDGKRVNLRQTETAILKVLLEKRDRPLSPDLLWHEVRGYDSGTAGKALTVQISNLRKRLGAWSDHIETLRDRGYLLNTRLPVS